MFLSSSVRLCLPPLKCRPISGKTLQRLDIYLGWCVAKLAYHLWPNQSESSIENVHAVIIFRIQPVRSVDLLPEFSQAVLTIWTCSHSPRFPKNSNASILMAALTTPLILTFACSSALAGSVYGMRESINGLLNLLAPHRYLARNRDINI